MMKVLNSYWMLVNGQYELLEQKFLNSEQSMQVQQNLGSCGCECASNLRASKFNAENQRIHIKTNKKIKERDELQKCKKKALTT